MPQQRAHAERVVSTHIRRERKVDGGELLHHAQEVHVCERDASKLAGRLKAEQALRSERAGHLGMHLAPFVHVARIERSASVTA